MGLFRRRRGHRRHRNERPAERPEVKENAEPESTGSEVESLKALVDSGNIVTVVLSTGEQLRGRIRYYDRECFSLGSEPRGPNIFLRKSSVKYICEE